MIKHDGISIRNEAFYHTLALAFIAEPCVTEIDSENELVWEYLLNYDNFLSTNISYYLSPYIKENTNVVYSSSPTTKMCKGHPDGKQHMFLLEETMEPILCEICACNICHHCCIKRPNQKHLCIECWSGENGVSLANKTENTINISKMRKTIIDHGWQVTESEATTEEIVELYDTLITYQAVNVFKDKDEQVRYPLFTKTQFTDKITYLGEIDLKDGGSFISNDVLISSGDVTKVIDLMSSFVRFTTNKYTKFVLIY